MANESIIKVEGLCVGYDDKVVLDKVSFEVKRGEIFVILGGSGCGKSTLLRALVGLIEPKKGKILINGRDIVNAVGVEREEIYRSFGVMYQNGALWGSMTVMENLTLALEEFTDLPQDAMEIICEMKLRLVGLEGIGNLMPSELSGGMRKRVAIARAMVLDPEIIFLDEPSAGLDPISSAGLDELLLNLSREFGITFVVVTHELESIFTIADEAVMLDHRVKRIVARGKPKDLRDRCDDPWVRQFFHRLSNLDSM